jgi:class 3 adenylate cyclase
MNFIQEATHIILLFSPSKGDAVLVTFSRLAEYEDESVIVTRALQCVIQVMRIHSEAEFKLDSIAADVAKKDGEEGSNSVTLKLHIGMTAGYNSRVIMGNSDRMDYVVFGPCFEEIGPMLDAAKPGNF